mgnify:CR=1 FL=1
MVRVNSTTKESTTNFSPANGTGLAVRTAIKDILEALRTVNSDTGDPSGSANLAAYQMHINTTNESSNEAILKIRNGTNTGFVEIGNVLDTNLGLLSKGGGVMTGVLQASAGSVSAPAINFGDGTTGFYRLNVNHIGVSNSGAITATFKPQLFEISGNMYMQHPNADTILQISSPDTGKNSYLDIAADNQTYTDFGLRVGRDDGENAKSFLEHRGTAAFEIKTREAAPIEFITQNFSRFKITETGTFVPIGNTFNNASTEAGAVCAKGFGTRTGRDTDSGDNNNASQSTGNLFNVWYDGATQREYFYIDNSRRGYFQYGVSDYRIKREIQDLDINGIERVKKLRTVSYKRANYDLYKASENVREGFIAHEVAEVIPDACKIPKDDANLQQIEFLPLIATLTKALQEAVAKIETLEAKVAVLEGS